MNETDDLVAALSPVVSAFKSLGIRHYVGESVARSFHGAARTTMDVDLVCELTTEFISSFVRSFKQDCYLSSTFAL